MRTSNNNNHPCDLEQLAREAAAVIDQTLVCGDFVFVTHRDRCLYIGTSTRNRPRWLEKNPGRWRLIEDVLREAALLAPPLESEINVEPVPAGPNDQTSSSEVRKNPCAADVVAMLQTALPKTWEMHLRNCLGDTDPADLLPAELVRFTDHVFWLVKQYGIKDPAGWLATYRARLDAAMAPAVPVELKSSVEIGDIPLQRDSAEFAPVKLGKGPAKTSNVSPPTPVATLAIGTTKAELLSRIKAAIEAGENPRDVAELLASAQENFRATQREIAEAVGRSPGWVNRLLKWRRSGYDENSPFGPTTTAGRVAHAQKRTKESSLTE